MTTQAATAAPVSDSYVSRFLTQVYLLMSVGLLVTGLVSVWTVTNYQLMGALLTTLVIAAAGGLPGGEVTSAPPAALVHGVTTTFRVAALVVGLAAGLAALAWWLDVRRRETREGAVVAAGGDG